MYYISKEEQDPKGHGFNIYCFMEHDPLEVLGPVPPSLILM